MSINYKGYKVALSLLTIFSVITTDAFAMNGARMIGFGPVQRSMGGASVGLPLDTATTISNPSGMVAIEGAMFQFGVTQLTGKTSIESVTMDANGSGAGMPDTSSPVESGTSSAAMPGFGLVLGGDTLKFGIGAYGTGGGGVDYTAGIYGADATSNLTKFRIAPALALDMGAISLGASYNYGMATMAFQAAGMPEAKEAAATGSGYTVGALIRMGEMFSIGFAHESQQDYSEFEYSGTGSDGSTTTGTLNLDSPAVTTVGFGFNFGAFKIAYDIETIKWSEVMGKDMPTSTYSYYTFDTNWKDQTVKKLGIELALGDSFIIRVGNNKGDSPTDDSASIENMVIPAFMENHTTVGGSFIFSDSFRVDFATTSADEATVTGADSASYIEAYETKASMTTSELGITASF